MQLKIIAIIALALLAANLPAAQTPDPLFEGLPAPAPDPDQSLATQTADWHKDAVVYHLWVSAFRDSNGDGIGDLRGIIQIEVTLPAQFSARSIQWILGKGPKPGIEAGRLKLGPLAPFESKAFSFEE